MFNKLLGKFPCELFRQREPMVLPITAFRTALGIVREPSRLDNLLPNGRAVSGAQ